MSWWGRRSISFFSFDLPITNGFWSIAFFYLFIPPSGDIL